MRLIARLGASVMLLLALCNGAVQADTLAAGTRHVIAVRGDGMVWTWGDNASQQLGDAALKQRVVPGQVAGLSGALAVSAGDIHNLVLLANGEVWAWGNNTYGQLGDGTQTSRDMPAKVQGLSDVVAIAAGGFSNLALKRDGTVWAWGFNIYGQLGLGHNNDVALPAQIGGLADVTGIAVCRNYSGCGAALKRDGSVWTWGNNQSGQLGDGARSNRSTPAKIAVTNVTRLVAGAEFLFAERADGSVWAWGRNSEGELADGTTANRLVPAAVAALQGYRRVAGGLYHALGVAPDGSLRAWGQNTAGEVGDGSKTQRTTPVAVSGAPSNPQMVLGGQWFSIAVDGDGGLWAWGENSAGQLGRGMLGTVRPQARKIPGLSATRLAAGRAHSLALSGDGTISAWGSNASGQLGVAGVTSSAAPQTVAGLKATALAACDSHSLALTAGGEAYAWGGNQYGQLGDATTTQRNAPQRITGLSGIAALGCGDAHSVALGQDGRVWTWGSNWLAQLGNGVASSAGSGTPALVPALTGITSIAVGGHFTLALAGDGTLYAWGRNDAGQIGDGGTTSRATPVAILNGVTRIVAGHAHAFAQTADGSWYGWGKNASGQLGNGDNANRTSPTLLTYPAFAVLAAAGGEGSAAHVSWNWGYTLGLTAGGELWGWGSGTSGQFADVALDSRVVPAKIGGVNAIVQVAAGKNHVLALGSDGTPWSWGDGADGRLGQAEELGLPGKVLASDYTTPFSLGNSAFRASASASGPAEAPTLTASLSVTGSDRGKEGKIYLAYQLPSGGLYFLAPQGWTRYLGGAIPAILSTTLGDHAGVFWPGLGVAGMTGAVFYVGFGLSEADLLDNRKYSAIYTVP